MDFPEDLRFPAFFLHFDPPPCHQPPGLSSILPTGNSFYNARLKRFSLIQQHTVSLAATPIVRSFVRSGLEPFFFFFYLSH